MVRSMVIKELWDVRGILVLGVLAHVMVLANLLGATFPDWIPNREQNQLPFPVSFPGILALYSGFFAAAVGLMQGWSDQRGQRWLFILPQPITRDGFILGKLAIGLSLGIGLYLLTFFLGVVIVRIPGVMPAPFEWWMTRSSWFFFFLIPSVYLGGFLSGIMKASWFGTKLVPLIGAAMISLFVIAGIPGAEGNLYPEHYPYLPLQVILFLGLCFLMTKTILNVSRERDYP